MGVYFSPPRISSIHTFPVCAQREFMCVLAQPPPSVSPAQCRQAESSTSFSCLLMPLDTAPKTKLSWWMADRLTKCFFQDATHWPPTDLRPREAYCVVPAPLIEEVADTCGCSYSVAEAALLSSEMSTVHAVSRIFSQEVSGVEGRVHAAVKEFLQPSCPAASFLHVRIPEPLCTTDLPLWELHAESWNYVARIMHFFERLLRSCNRTCLVCNSPLDYIGLKPSICSSELCSFSFAQFGLGLDILTEFKTNRYVCFLFHMATLAPLS
jgi:hypothetical protein